MAIEDNILEKNIEAIYQNAANKKEGGGWKAISDIQTRITKEIAENNIPTGFNDKVQELLVSQKKENPNLDEKSATKAAINGAIEDATHKEFVSKLKDKTQENPILAGIMNIIAIFSKANKVIDGSWAERIEVLREGFAIEARDLGAAWNDNKGFMASFSERSRNENISNWLGITDKNEKEQFISALTSEKPLQLPTRVASVTPMQQMQKAEERMAALEAEREKATKHEVKGGNEAAHPEASQADLPANGNGHTKGQPKQAKR